MKIKSNQQGLEGGLTGLLAVALLCVSVLLLAASFKAAPVKPQPETGVILREQPLTLGTYPNTSIPLSTDNTVTPNAAPTNTTSITVSTSTSFHGTLAGDPITGVVRVTDAHPAGSYTITVRAFDAGTQSATTTFTLMVTTPQTCNQVTFAPMAKFCVGSVPQDVAIGDFNGDGKQDIAATATTYTTGTISISLGDGAGHFGSPAEFNVGIGAHAPAVGDFNGDGKQDLVVAKSNAVSIMLGDGTGNFSAPTSITTGDGYSWVAVGDFNGDGKQDLAVAHGGWGNVSILLGNGEGGFTCCLDFDAGNEVNSVAVGDFNTDGKQDLAVPNTNGVAILFGDGTGHFGAPTNFGVGAVPISPVIADFNGDGRQDILVRNSGSNNVSILLGNGAGSFSTVTVDLGAQASSIVVGDFNGDGTLDLAATAYYTDNLSILLGNGTGGFSSPTNLYAGSGPQSVAVGDFNGDGIQDLAVGHGSTTWSVGILVRSCPGTPTPTATPLPSPALGHYPDTSVALSADTTVTPDTAPKNTTGINVSTSTNFKGTFAVDPTTGVVRVTDAHPAGTYTVTVRAFDGPGPTATSTFTLTVTTPVMCLPVSFAPATTFGAGIYPQIVVVGDFNGDGKQDLAITYYGIGPPHPQPGGVSILLGDGAGNFNANFFSFARPGSLAVGDFNGDGKQDLAMIDYDVLILSGDGAGHFTRGCINFSAGNYPSAVAVGDFNGDGKQDLAVGNPDAANVFILLGDGTGGFDGPTTFGAGTAPLSVAVGDFNGDGKQDLAVANYGSNNISILLGDGAGHFSTPNNFGAGDEPYSVALGDFNRDGKQDLAVTNPESNTVSILLGDGAGHFSAPLSFSAGSSPGSLAVGDFNGDGKQDLAVSNGDSQSLSILLGDGTGHFSAPIGFGAGSYPGSLAVGDFNADGKQDLAIVDANSQNVSILLRDCGPGPTPTATATATPTATATATATPTSTPTLIVTNTNDSGSGSLRQVLADAHDGDIIGFDPALNGQTIPLTSGELVIDKDISINGPGVDLMTVSRSQNAPGSRIIHIMPGHTVAIQGLTISGGSIDKFDPAFSGAGIFNEQGTLTIDSCTVSGNFSFYEGGGIANVGSLTVSQSTIIGNFGGFDGGGISNSGTLTMMNSMVRNNTAGLPQGVGGTTGNGAGIYNAGMAAIVSCTIDHNTASGSNQGSAGGGIFSAGSGPLTVSNSTISQNVAAITGGAIYGGGSITNCTISGNTAPQGGGIYVTSALEIGNTILNTGANGANILGGTVTSRGYNLSSDDGGGFLTAPGDQLNTDPLLGPLQGNGGPTFTHDLLKGSPALNTGDPNFTPPPSTDQRGFPRVHNGRIDIGSVEVQSGTPPTPTPTATPSPARPLNLSTRLLVQTGDQVGIGGFIITGSAPKEVLLRAIGPSLIGAGILDALADPTLELHGPAGFTTLTNDNWRDTQEAQIIATGIPPTDNLESAIVATLDAGAYTAIVSGKNDTSGVGLVEIYDLGSAASQLANISTRAFVGTADNVVIGGFILGGGDHAHIFIHAGSSGISPALAGAILELRDGSGTLIASNDNCQSSIIGPPNPNDACIDISLPAGPYTATLAGTDGGTGIGILEIYNLN